MNEMRGECERWEKNESTPKYHLWSNIFHQSSRRNRQSKLSNQQGTSFLNHNAPLRETRPSTNADRPPWHLVASNEVAKRRLAQEQRRFLLRLLLLLMLQWMLPCCRDRLLMLLLLPWSNASRGTINNTATWRNERTILAIRAPSINAESRLVQRCVVETPAVTWRTLTYVIRRWWSCDTVRPYIDVKAPNKRCSCSTLNDKKNVWSLEYPTEQKLLQKADVLDGCYNNGFTVL